MVAKEDDANVVNDPAHSKTTKDVSEAPSLIADSANNSPKKRTPARTKKSKSVEDYVNLGKVSPMTPGEDEWKDIPNEKFTLTKYKTNGHFDFRSMAKEEEHRGKSIAKGMTKFKANPQKYLGLTYQTSMIGWPTNQQEYNLIPRAGTEGLTPCDVDADGAWMTVLLQTYHHLPSFPNNDLPVEFRDPWTDDMTHKGRKIHQMKKPIMPGRGMGIGDTPLLKTIGDIDPSDIHQGQVGDCWLLSAISAAAEFDGAIKKLYRKTPRLDERPLAEPNHYTITLWDLATWTEKDYVIDERLAADPTRDDNALLSCKLSEDGELWACYLEKAIAIHCGGWDAITGGQCSTSPITLIDHCELTFGFCD